MLTPAKTAVERKADERARLRALGRVPIEAWVHPEDRERIQAFIARLNKAREST